MNNFKLVEFPCDVDLVSNRDYELKQHFQTDDPRVSAVNSPNKILKQADIQLHNVFWVGSTHISVYEVRLCAELFRWHIQVTMAFDLAEFYQVYVGDEIESL